MAQQEVWAIIVAAGRGQQLKSGADTAFLGIGSRPALAHSLGAFERCPGVEGMVIVASRERLDAMQEMVRRYGAGKPTRVVPGYLSHRASLRAGYQAIDPECEWVVVHDVSRPLITPALIQAVLASARRYGNGVTAVRVDEPVAMVQGRAVRAEEVCKADALWLVQTPQCYRRSLLERLLAAADKAKLKDEDPAAALPLIQELIRLVPCATANLRLTHPDDLALTANLLP